MNVCNCGKPVYCRNECRSCYLKTWRKANPDKTKFYNSSYTKTPRECGGCNRVAEMHSETLCGTCYRQQWRRENTDRSKKLNRYLSSLRRARERNATPKWLTQQHKQDMRAIYNQCPDGLHVDHILPIGGKEVCGLQVPWNLQYLTPAENFRKNNKLIGE